MLSDFAQTLERSFQFGAFAAKHGKAERDIRDTFAAVVYRPVFEFSSQGLARAKMKKFAQFMSEYRRWERSGGMEVGVDGGKVVEVGKAEAGKAEVGKAEVGKSECKARKRKEPEAVAKGKPDKKSKAGFVAEQKPPGDKLVLTDGIYR